MTSDESAAAQRWRRMVEIPEGAATVEELTTRTLEGVSVAPVYFPDEVGDRPAPLIESGPWHSLPLLDRPTLEENLTLLAPAREREAGGAWIRLGVEPGWGLRDPDVAAIRTLVAPLPEGGIAILEAPGVAPAAALLGAAASGSSAREEGPVVELCLGLDPGAEVALGGAAWPLEPAGRRFLGELLAWKGPARSRVLVASGLRYHLAGAHAVDELALALAGAVETARSLASLGVDWSTVVRQTVASYAVGEEMFFDVAKLRAARWLWAKVGRALGSAEAPLVHAMTSPRRHGLLEPATNLLRTTVASAAAVLGGADLLTVVPADGRADGRWARLAANVPALLRHEAGLAALGDATRGSWCVEGLTEALARRAWDRFRDIEREGGLFAAARSGWIAETLAATVARREARVACGDRMVVGVTDYAPLDGTPLPVAVAPTPSPSTLPEAPLAELLARAAGGARLAELLGAPAERITPVVRPVREAATYEELRAPADHQAAGGSRPAALAICWGRPVEHRSAIDRARRWLAVAGIRLETGAPVRTATEALERWTESGLDIAICCPPGRGNDQLTVDVARLLEGHGPGRIAWAVRPDAPVTAPVFAVGTDRLAALRDLLGSTAPAES